MPLVLLILCASRLSMVTLSAYHVTLEIIPVSESCGW